MDLQVLYRGGTLNPGSFGQVRTLCVLLEPLIVCRRAHTRILESSMYIYIIANIRTTKMYVIIAQVCNSKRSRMARDHSTLVLDSRKKQKMEVMGSVVLQESGKGEL